MFDYNPKESGIKKFSYILRILIALILCIYIGLVIWLNTDTASSYLGQQAATALSKKLGTEVTVDKVKVGLFNRIDLINVHIDDQRRKNLLTAQSVSARFQVLSLIQHRLDINHIGLYNAQIHLYKTTSDAPYNFQFIIDSLSSKDKNGKPLAIKANSIVCSNIQLSYDVWDQAVTPAQFNANHIHLMRFTGSFSLNHQPNKYTHIRVRNILLKEASGLEIKHGRCIANITDEDIHLENLFLKLPYSTLSLPQATWMSKQKSLKNLQLDATIHPADIKPFYKPLTSIDETLQFQLNIKEYNQQLYTQLKLHDAEKELRLNVQALISPLLFQKKQLHTSGDIQECFIGKKWLTKVPQLLHSKSLEKQLLSIGYIDHHGSFSIHNKNITLQGTTQSEYGSWEEKIQLINQHLQGNVQFTHLHSGTLLPPEMCIKNGNGNLHVEGTLQPTQLNVNTQLQQLEWNGYTYHDIQLKGNVTAQEAQAELQVNDPNLRTDIHTTIQYGQTLGIETEGTINKLAPAMLHLTNAYGNCLLSSHFQAIYQTQQQEEHLQLDIQDFNIQDSIKKFACKQLSLVMQQNSDQSNVTIQSDMLDASVMGNLPLKDISNALLTYIEHSLPSLKKWVQYTPLPNKDLDFNIQVKSSDFLQYFLHLPLQLEKPANLTGYLDSRQNKIKVTTWLPEFTYNDSKYADGSVFLTGNTDSLNLLAQITKTFKKDQVRMEMNMPIKGNTLYPTLEWKTEHAHGTKGTLNAVCQFFAENGKEKFADIQINPSWFTIQDSLWNISKSKIQLHDNTIQVSPIEIRQGNKYISIHNQNGDKSNFKLTLHGLNISHLQDLLNFHPVEFAGDLYGTASIPTHIDKNLYIPAQLQVRNFRFQNGRMGVLDINASWQNNIQKVNIHAKAHETKHDSLLINGYVDVAENNLELNFTPMHTNLEFLNSWLGNIIGEARGSLTGQLQLKGPLSGLDFTGSAVIDTMSFRPPLTNVLYTLAGDSVKMVSGKFIFCNWHLNDGEKGQCLINGAVTHHKLSNFGYDMNFDAHRFHAYNWNGEDREDFWGNITTDGNGRLHGDTKHVYADLELTPRKGTFFYNNSGNDNTSGNEFIYFHNGKIVAHDDPKDTKQDNVLKDNSTDIYMNMTVNTNPNVRLVILTDRKNGDGLYLRGNGPISMNWHNKGKFNINGLYLTTTGEYHLTIQDLMKRTFQIQPNGYLRFSGSADEGDINMKGVYTVHSVSLSDLNIGQNISNSTTTVNCELNFNGKTNNPKVTFGLDFPTAGDDMRQTLGNAISSQEDLNMQMLYLLTIGRFYTYDFENSGNTTTQNQSVLAMQSLAANTLGNSLSSIINQAFHVTNWSFAPNFATGKMGWDDMEVGGRIQGSLLQNRLRLSGNFGYREQTTYSNNFVGDFNIRYLLNPKGTISLKAYSETNDRYFSRSSLSTQGGGIMFQHNFNKLGDIFRKKKTTLKKTK